VEAAIRDSALGLNPQTEGQVIRVPLPVLTGERRNELIKAAGKYAEGTRVAIRGVRRDGMEQAKGFEKKKEISEDEAKAWSEEIQKLTDQYVKSVDQALTDKEKDIRQV
jgi:ribosome recycling factor